MRTLIDRNWMENQVKLLQPWQQKAYEMFSSMIADKENNYPCILGRQGFLQNHIRFSFAGDPRNDSAVLDLSKALYAYGKCTAEDIGKYTSLVVFFHTPDKMLSNYSVEDYQQLFWKLLNGVSFVDLTKWPDNLPADPAHHKWEFCFDGEPYFVFCATPAHIRRKSRYFPFLMLAFQPRWVFKTINDTSQFGRNIKKATRKRLISYDDIGPHPDLKWYGEPDNHEWKQYFLSDNDSSPTECPFKRVESGKT